MTQTLRDLIETNDFSGFDIQTADLVLGPNEIETALYGSEANHSLDYDLITKFSSKHGFEIVCVNTWLCTDRYVGLWVLRVDLKPIAVLWLPDRKSDVEVFFLSEVCAQIFQAQWEAVKSPPRSEASIIESVILNMPIAPLGEDGYALASHGRACTPGLSPEGVQAWIDAQGGLDRISDLPMLRHAKTSLSRILDDYEVNILAPLRAMTPRGNEVAERDHHLHAVEEECRPARELRDALSARLEDITAPSPTIIA